MWDQRYSSESYAYGTAPNDFLVQQVSQLPKGKVLCLGEGEGRNAVWLAEQGFDVTAIDASGVGLKKARQLAEARHVEITTIHADLEDYRIEENSWDAIVSIFCHLPPQLRTSMHHAVVTGLRHGGVYLLEAYTPEQLEYGTGGPPSAELMMDLDTLEKELQGLEFLYKNERTREVLEGDYHTGLGAVVQLVGRKN